VTLKNVYITYVGQLLSKGNVAYACSRLSETLMRVGNIRYLQTCIGLNVPTKCLQIPLVVDKTLKRRLDI